MHNKCMYTVAMKDYINNFRNKNIIYMNADNFRNKISIILQHNEYNNNAMQCPAFLLDDLMEKVELLSNLFNLR